jgi:hypothetical protein
MQPRLRSILTDALAREEDMELIPYQLTAGAAPDAEAPDAIVCQIDDPLDVALPDRLFRTMPRGRVLLVADTGDQAAVYELQPARRVFLDVSVAQLISAIRSGLNTHPH